MFDLQRIFHTGFAVEDIDVSQKAFSGDLNLKWSEIRNFDNMDFWTPEEGAHQLDVRACYSVPGPHHLELVQGPKGSFYDVNLAPDNRHIGVWVDDLPKEAHRMIKQGWSVKGSAMSPQDGFGIIAYLSAPVPGLLIELVSKDLEPIIAEWMNG